MAICSSSECGAEIIWATNVNSGKSAPVDAQPSPDGNVLLDATTDPPRYRVMTKEDKRSADRASGVPRHKLHFATCPAADTFRRQK